MANPIKPVGSRRHSILAALGAAGAAVLARGEARADIVTVPVNEDIGFAPGDSFFGTLVLPGGEIHVDAYHSSSFRGILAGNPPFTTNPTSFKVYFPHVFPLFERLDAGVTFGTSPGTIRHDAYIDVRTTGGGGSQGTFDEKYFLFRFAPAGGTPIYGYFQGSETDSSYRNMTFHLDSYTYDTTGAEIATGATAVPEPSSLALLAMAAAVTGAEGVRRWKSARRAGGDAA